MSRRRSVGGLDLLRLGVFGLRTRPGRVVLSALGIAIGIAAMLAVVGISSSSKAKVDQVLDTLARKVSPRILRAPARLDRLAFEVEEYLTGSRRSFDLPLDLTLTTGFRREVVRHLPEIPYGRTATYTDVAALTGSPRAVRAVGTACAKNPLPLVVPCHRVVRSDGTTGQYAGGPAAKRWLLELEAAS